MAKEKITIELSKEEIAQIKRLVKFSSDFKTDNLVWGYYDDFYELVDRELNSISDSLITKILVL